MAGGGSHMMAISVSQPFADLITGGEKTVDLRGWNTAFRGRLAIHAPKRVRTADCKRLGVNPGGLVTGAIVGTAELYGVKRYESAAEVAADAASHRAGPGLGSKRYGFLLRRARRLAVPIPYPGRLGIFRLGGLEPARRGRGRIVADIIDEEYRHQWINHH